MGLAVALRHWSVLRNAHPVMKPQNSLRISWFWTEGCTHLLTLYNAPEASVPASYASFAEKMGDRMKHAYALVRDHLKVAKERSKCTYDMRVLARSTRLVTGCIILTQENLQGTKWRRKFSGPFLVTKAIGPVNVMV